MAEVHSSLLNNMFSYAEGKKWKLMKNTIKYDSMTKGFIKEKYINNFLAEQEYKT